MPGELRTLFETADLDEAVSVLSGSYSPHRLTLLDSSRSFKACHRAGGFDGLSLNILSYGSDVRAETSPFCDYVLLSQVRSGRYHIASNEGERWLSSGDIVALDPYTAYSMEFLDECQMVQMRIDRAAWSEALAVLRGCDDPRHMRFAVSAAADPVVEDRCRSLMNLIANDVVPQDWTARSPLLRNQIIQLCVAVLLDRPMQNGAKESSGRGASRVVKRALDYFEVNCQEDIGVLDVSLAVGISPRALQATFRRELGVSPMGALREIRLKRAYADLKRLSPQETSVTEVALQWGFNNLGRFAVEFRKRFDRSPHQVLRS